MFRVGVGSLCLVLLIGYVCCKNIYVTYNDTEFRMMGKLTPACVQKYYSLYVTHDMPQRRYLYHHEYKEQAEAKKRYENKIGWRIIGGQKLDITEAPYSVLYGPYCGGTLIAPDWVITSAHCLTEDTFVVAGATKAAEGKIYPICAHYLHPGWNDKDKPHYHDNDYLLLLLEKPVPVTPQSLPVAIGSVTDIVPGAMLSVTGWGHIKTKQRNMQNELHQVSLPIISQESCLAVNHKFYTGITERMFCAGFPDGGKDACQGDSGGSAVVNDKLVGMVSFGVGCAQKGRPGVYSSVPSVRPWIREVTGLPL